MGCKGGAEIAVEIQEKRSSPKVGLVQIIVEASSIRGGSRNTELCQLVSGWRCRCVLRDYRALGRRFDSVKTPTTQTPMNLNFIDPQTRILNYF